MSDQPRTEAGRRLLDREGWPAYMVEAVLAIEAEAQTELRRSLWLSCPHDGKYGDDGEMQCSMGGHPADFRRDDAITLVGHIVAAAAPSIEAEALPSEGELAAALRTLDTGPDGSRYSHTYEADSPQAFAAAILAALREARS